MAIHINTYKHPAELLEQHKTFLYQDEVANSLMIGLLTMLSTSDYKGSETDLFMALYEDEELRLILIQTRPENAIVYAPDLTPEITQELVSHLQSIGFRLNGLIGAEDVVRSISEGIEQTWPCTSKIYMEQVIYSAENIYPPMPCDGLMRLANLKDMILVTDWLGKFAVEAFEPITTQAAQAQAREKIAAKEIYLWENGTVVSMAATARPTDNGTSINYVYTPVQHRGRGYASNVVAHLSEQVLFSGKKFCTLFTDAHNPTSNNIYQEIGYEPHASFLYMTYDYK